MFWPCETRTSTCRNFATISSGLYRFLVITVLLDVKDIPQVGPLQWGRITSSVSVAVIRSLTKGLTHWLNASGKSVMDLTGCANPLPRFWCSAVLFWAGDGDRSAWPLSAFSFLIILGNLGTLYGINVWSGELFNALEKYQTRTV